MSKPKSVSDYPDEPEGARGYERGKAYFLKTVTDYYVGVCINVTPTEIILDQAAWVPDTGDLAEFLKGANPRNCEPFPDGMACIVTRGVITAGAPWPHKLLRTVIRT
jgi:hypothetical protein